MKRLNLKEMENIEGGKFWGTSCDPVPISRELVNFSPTVDGEPISDNYQAVCTYSCNYYVLGIAVSSSTQTGACPSFNSGGMNVID